MTIDSNAAPKTERITGTLHKRGYVRPAPMGDESLTREKTEQSEVADRHQDSGQEKVNGGR